MDKDNCVIYYRNLEQYLELGMKFKENTQNTKILTKRLDEILY